MRSLKVNSHWWAEVDDLAVWSSPDSSSTPPCLEMPAMLQWRSTSPERSTPGPLAYHMENKQRQDGSRVGKECVSTGRHRCGRAHYKKTTTQTLSRTSHTNNIYN